MPRKRKAKKAQPKPQCAICTDAMTLKSTIPRAHIFPELRTYQCVGCGNLRTVEDELELVIPEITKVAA
jgi:hypothetical protein